MAPNYESSSDVPLIEPHFIVLFLHFINQLICVCNFIIESVKIQDEVTSLIQPLLDLADAGKIAFRPAVELSYLTEEEQNSLLDSINSEQSTPSLAQALKMKEFSQNGRLNADVILSIMCEQKPNQKAKISFQSERLQPFIPKNFTAKQTEDYVIKALEYYHRHQLRQKERDR